MHLRTQLRTLLTIGFTLAVGMGTTTASAEETTSLLKVPQFAAPAKTPQPIFGAGPIAAAAQAATTATTAMNQHQFGVGLRVGGSSPLFGGSVRYFFYGGPLGIQAELVAFGEDLGPSDFSNVQFSVAAIYRFVEQKFDGPVSITPYAGGGLNFIHSDFDEDDFDELGPDETTVGVLLFGGVEIFFEKVPQLGVSGELTFTSNDDIDGGSFGSASLGGAAFTAAAHWYFW